MVRASLLAGVVLLFGALRAECADLLSFPVRFTWETAKSGDIETDRGFAVRIDRADLMSAGFALVPCAEQGAQLTAGAIRVGHFSGVLPNQLPLERAESLVERAPYTIDGFDPPDIAYCQAHYVLGGPRGGHSLTIEGKYRAPGSDVWVDFSATTPEAYGAFVPLLSIQRRALKGKLGGIRGVTVQRPASGWFDGIDFTSASGPQIGRAILRRIANGTVVTLQR